MPNTGVLTNFFSFHFELFSVAFAALLEVVGIYLVSIGELQYGKDESPLFRD